MNPQEIPSDLIIYSPEVLQAKKESKPIVALESTYSTWYGISRKS